MMTKNYKGRSRECIVIFDGEKLGTRQGITNVPESRERVNDPLPQVNIL